MMHRTSRIGLGLLLLLVGTIVSPAVFAQDVNTPACLTQTYDALAHEKRVYRSVLFGQKASKELPIGSVQFDKEGNTWIKKANNSWNSLAKGFEGTTWSDGLMNTRADVSPRRGIMEIKKTPTSDLIPAITQAFRAYQCHVYAVCTAALQSQSTATGTTMLAVQPDGCISIDEPVLTSCRNNTQFTVGGNTCLSIANAMLDQEQQALVLLVSYDASYRSLLQFTGVFEGFLDDFRFPLLQPLWQTVRAMGALAHIPCFIGQCDE